MPIFIGSAIIVTTLHCQNTVRFVEGPEKGEKHEEQVGGGERRVEGRAGVGGRSTESRPR